MSDLTHRHPLCKDACPSEFAFDRFQAGELDPAAEAEVRAALDACEGCAERWAQRNQAYAAAIGAERDALIQSVVRAARPEAKAAADGIAARLTRLFTLPHLRWAMGITVVLLVTVLVRPMLEVPSSGVAPSEQPRSNTQIQLKSSGLALQLHRQVDDGSKPVEPGAKLKAGDKLRFEIATPKPGQLMVVGVEAGGAIYPCYPSVDADVRSRPVGVVEKRVLDGAVELDQSIGRERFVAVLCERSFSAKVLKLLDGKLVAPRGCLTTTVAIEKQ